MPVKNQADIQYSEPAHVGNASCSEIYYTVKQGC